MPPTRPLATPCRYGLNCTRPDCFYTHPKGVTKDQRQLCSFGSSCFRKVCHLDHPNGRMMDQLRPNIDYCATCILVRPADIGQISGAFQDEFPASDESMDSCEFVAAVPLGVAFKDWKKYRGVSSTGTPDAVPSSLENIRLFPRTRKGETLLKDPAKRVAMRWSPTPYRPWKTLERMATHDQHWEDNQDMYVLCAGYHSSTAKDGICIELSVTGAVKKEDGGDAGKAGTRVAREILGLPGANEQKWFVFHIARQDEWENEAQFVTVKTILDTTKLPPASRRRAARSSVASATPVEAPAKTPSLTFPPRLPAPSAKPTARATAVLKAGPASGAAATVPGVAMATPSFTTKASAQGPVAPIGTTSPAERTNSDSVNGKPSNATGRGLSQPQPPQPPTTLQQSYRQQQSPRAMPPAIPQQRHQQQQGPLPPPPPPPPAMLQQHHQQHPPLPPPPPPMLLPHQQQELLISGRQAMFYPPSTVSAPGSTDSELGSSALSFGSYVDDASASVTAPPFSSTPLPLGTANKAAFPFGSSSGGGVGMLGQRAPLGGSSDATVVTPAGMKATDELSELLEGLNMAKYRSRFDAKQLDLKALRLMTTEDELLGVGLPLGPRIKIMKELGIERPDT